MAIKVRKGSITVWDKQGNKHPMDSFTDRVEVIPVGLKEQVQKNTDDIKALKRLTEGFTKAEGKYV